MIIFLASPIEHLGRKAVSPICPLGPCGPRKLMKITSG